MALPNTECVRLMWLSSEKITDFPDKWTATDLIYLEYNAVFEYSASCKVISSRAEAED